MKIGWIRPRNREARLPAFVGSSDALPRGHHMALDFLPKFDDLLWHAHLGEVRIVHALFLKRYCYASRLAFSVSADDVHTARQIARVEGELTTTREKP